MAEESEYFQNKRMSVPSKRRIKSLKQYKDMSDDEFDQMWEKKVSGVQTNKEFESRIARKIEEFGQDYDLDDLKANDKLTLRALAQAYINLEDLENLAYHSRQHGLEMDDILAMEKVNSVMSKLRVDISSMQGDLKITRKVRKGDKEESVIAYIDTLKSKAKQFYRSRMSYIFCPKCQMLLGTIWSQYPEEKKNKIRFTCGRVLENGVKCATVVDVSTEELLEKGGVNIQDVPDFFK